MKFRRRHHSSVLLVLLVIGGSVGQEADCPNPCPVDFTGFTTRPGSECKHYVSCGNGLVVQDLVCFGDTIFNENAKYCDWPSSYACPSVTCPEREADENAAIEVIEGSVVSEADCPNPCPDDFTGFTARPGSECKQYVSCGNGVVTQEFECYGDLIFNENAKYCDWPSSYSCPAMTCPEGEASFTQQSSTPISSTLNTSTPISFAPSPSTPTTSAPISSISVSIPPSSTPIPVAPISSTLGSSAPIPSLANIGSPTLNPQPTTPKYMPSYDQFQYFRSYLEDREEILNAIIFQSNGIPSTAYKFSDFMKSLEIAVLQLPVDKAFFLGDATISGMEYGLINLAAFLSSAMEEGIRIDSCDEFNTDAIYGTNYPLSNACGQYGRSWDLEECSGMEPFHCALDKTMETTAVDTVENSMPPFTCRARTMNGDFPGFYDAINNLVDETPYANTVGRTDIEGCCWWGRGALLTRGRCTLGKLNAYLGIGALERGVDVYPDINFCVDPEVICKHPKTNELRWVLGMLEWSDRIQSYNNLNPGWNYIDELKNFAKGYSADGVINEEFVKAVVNITTQNCHDDSCWNRWDLSETKQLFVDSRVDHFTKILTKVFDVYITYRPTASPLAITPNPTLAPSVTQRLTSPAPEVVTNKPTRQPNANGVNALPPNPAQQRNTCFGHLAYVTLAIHIVIWA